MVATAAETATARFVLNKRLILPTPFRSWPALEQAMPTWFSGAGLATDSPPRPSDQIWGGGIDVPPHSDPRAAACQSFGWGSAKLERFLPTTTHVKAA